MSSYIRSLRHAAHSTPHPSADDDAEHGVSTSVTYFVLPYEDFAALVRRTIMTNTGADALTLGALKCLAKIQPCSGKLGWGLKF